MYAYICIQLQIHIYCQCKAEFGAQLQDYKCNEKIKLILSIYGSSTMHVEYVHLPHNVYLPL